MQIVLANFGYSLSYARQSKLFNLSCITVPDKANYSILVASPPTAGPRPPLPSMSVNHFQGTCLCEETGILVQEGRAGILGQRVV
jgi:hypothetical protein